MITGITVENFKGIRDRAHLDIKPLTLLFGPNNAGKSTILHAIHYAREVLERHNLDADRTLSGGESIDLGGFTSFVHGRDLEREVRLRFDMKLTVGALPQLMDLAEEEKDFLNKTVTNFDAVSTGAQQCVARIDFEARSCWVEFAIAWDAQTRSPNVIECTTGFDGQQVATIHFDPLSRAVKIADIHFAHPLFHWRLALEKWPHLKEKALKAVEREPTDDPEARLQEELEYLLRPNFSLVPWEASNIMRAIEAVRGKQTPWIPGDDQRGSIERSRDIENQFHSTLLYWYLEMIYENAEDGTAMEWDEETITIPLVGQPDALPVPSSLLILGVELLEHRPDHVPRDKTYLKQGPRDFGAILTHILASPVELLRRSIAELRHLGPLRHIPAREFSPARVPDDNRKASGLAAWDSLAWAPDELLEQVNGWMGRADRLKSGVRLERERVKLVPADLNFPAELQAQFDKAPIHTATVLVNAATGLAVQPKEVGVGISQLLPVVVSLLDPRGGILSIEQPELHLHPRMQCEMGDLFIFGALGEHPKTIIIETHSEHLILRILRRIRETTRGKPHQGIRVTPNEVAVWYVGQEEGRSVPVTIGIDEHGEFTVPWPDDFFESDFYERFS